MIALASALACGKSDAPKADSTAHAAAPAEPVEDLTKADTNIAPQLGVKLARMKHLPSGLYVEDKKIGTGARADSGKWVRIQYTSWLSDGKKVDSSRDRKEPFKFPIGYERVIKAWDVGIPGMRVGGRRLMVVPPALGYGKAGQPGTVPSRATLVFDVELMQVF